MIRTYSEISRLKSFEERFRYLQLKGKIGEDTFGFERFLNQSFYRSKEWKQIRDFVIARDNGCDLGLAGFGIHGKILIHHMNPISVSDIYDASDYLLNPEYLICAKMETHNAIHYGDERILESINLVERKQNDTCPWRH